MEGSWVLVDFYARILSGLEDKLVCCSRLAANMVRMQPPTI
jgi:hypothetical protein